MATGESDVVFGRYRIDRRESRLYCGSDPVDLRPKAWELLMLLASRPNALFGFDEINDRLWADVVVAPHALTKLVNDLRRALGAEGAGLIENVPRRGYRLRVETRSPAAEEVPLFVAREAELGQLAEHWQGALRGQRQFVFVSGETGIGKTSLLDQFLRGIAAQSPASPLIARGQCVPLLGEPVPYGPMVEALQRIASQGSVLARLRQCAPAWLLQLRGLIPADESMELLALLAGSGAQRMLNEAAVLFEALAAESPLVVVLEDAHWADGATIDLLRALMQRREPARLLFLVSYRPAEVALERHPLHAVAQLAGRVPGGHRIALGGLAPAGIAQYLERRFAAATDAALSPLLERATAGNPLFLGLMTEHLVDRGWLDRSDGRWLHDATPEAADLGMPASLREMIELEVVSAAGESIDALEAAALEGDRFTAEAVAAATGARVEDVDQACYELARARHIVRFDDTGEQPTYEFIHALYRQVLAERVAPARGRALHQRLGEHLEAAAGADLVPYAARLAYHFGAAGDRERRVQYLELSALNSAMRFAMREVRETLGRVIETIRELPESPQRSLREAERLLDFANSSLLDGFVYDTHDAHAVYERAGQLAAANGEARLEFRAKLGRCYTSAISGRDDAESIADDLVRAAADGHPELTAVAQTYATLAKLLRGECASALEHSRAAVEALPYATPGIPAVYDLESRLRMFRSLVFDLMNRPEESRAEYRIALERARSKSVFEMTELLLWQLHGCAIRGDANEALGATELGIKISTAHGMPVWDDTMRLYRVWAQMRTGESTTEELEAVLGADTLRRSINACEYMTILLADEHRARGDLAAARRALERCRIVALRHVEAERWRALGQLLLAERAARTSAPATSLADGLSGEQCLQRAIDIAQRQGATIFEQRARRALDAAGVGRSCAPD